MGGSVISAVCSDVLGSSFGFTCRDCASHFGAADWSFPCLVALSAAVGDCCLSAGFVNTVLCS